MITDLQREVVTVDTVDHLLRPRRLPACERRARQRRVLYIVRRGRCGAQPRRAGHRDRGHERDSWDSPLARADKILIVVGRTRQSNPPPWAGRSCTSRRRSSGSSRLCRTAGWRTAGRPCDPRRWRWSGRRCPIRAPRPRSLRPCSFSPGTCRAQRDAKCSLGDAKSSLGDAKSSLGDAKSSLGDAKCSLGDAKRLAG
jgi:hypothetical protein